MENLILENLIVLILIGSGLLPFLYLNTMPIMAENKGK